MRVKLSIPEGQGSLLQWFDTSNLDNEENDLSCCICQEEVVAGQDALDLGCPCTPELRVGHKWCFISAATHRASRDSLLMQCFQNSHPVRLGDFDDEVFPPTFYDACSHFEGSDLDDGSIVSWTSTASSIEKFKKKKAALSNPVAEERTPPAEDDPFTVTKEDERQEMYDYFGEEDKCGLRPWFTRKRAELDARFGRKHDSAAEWKIREVLRTQHHFGGTPPDTDEDFGDIPTEFFLYEGAEEHEVTGTLAEYDDDAASTAGDIGWDDLDEWELPALPDDEQFHTPTGLRDVEVASS